MTPIPSIDELKQQARRLRQAMDDRGTPMPQSSVLELLARQHGLRDWNTLSALAARPNDRPALPATVGAQVRGRYLNHPFTGKVLALSSHPTSGLYKITIHFDEPVDVVTFDSFSAFRQRINAQIDADGISPRKTSNGVPQLILEG